MESELRSIKKNKKNLQYEERNYLMDNVKILLIFLVVVGHVIEKYIWQSNTIKSIYTLIYFFHIPLFIFISGYFSKNIEKSRDKAVKDVLLLYIVLNTLWYLFTSWSAGSFSISFITPGWVLWYLLSLFTWRVLLKDLIEIRFIVPLTFIAALLAGGLSEIDGKFSLSRTICFLPFFLLGYFSNEKHITAIKKIPALAAIPGLTAIGILAFNINTIIPGFNVSFLYFSGPYKNYGLDLLTGIINRIEIYTIAIAASVFVLSLIPKRKFVLSYIGQQTLTIFILHAYIVKIMAKQFPSIGTSLAIDILIYSSPIVITLVLSSKPVVNIFDKFIYYIKRVAFTRAIS